MVIPKNIYKIVIVSPNDVNEEINTIYETIKEINEYFKDTNIGFEIYNWLKDVSPAIHLKGPQGRIDDQLKIQDADILIGVFFLRFGNPTFDCKSGTEYEINESIKYFNKNSKPEIKVYFKNPKGINLDEFSDDDYKQFNLVKGYKNKLSKLGIIDVFDNKEYFIRKTKKHIMDFAIKMLKSSNVDNPIKEDWRIKEINNEESFLNSINSNVSFKLNAKTYNLSKVGAFESDKIEFEKEFDGAQIIIKDVHDLNIFSDLKNKSEILIEPRYAFVLVFINCKNIFLSNLIFGHKPMSGYCTGGVLKFENCTDICINNSVLFGSGTEGIDLNKVNSFNCKYTFIENCTYGIMSIRRSKDINFKGCTIRNNCLLPLSSIGVEDFSDINFENCLFDGNYISRETKVLKTYFFGNDASTNLVVKNSKIINNKVDYLAYNKKYIDLINVDIKNNKFYEGLYVK